MHTPHSAFLKSYEKSHLVVLGPVSVRVPPSMINSSSSLSSRIVQSIAALDRSRVVSPDKGRERFSRSSHSALPRSNTRRSRNARGGGGLSMSKFLRLLLLYWRHHGSEHT